MKLSNRQRGNRRIELSMTSMIDVVFLLLIFFLVTTTFLRPEQQVASAIKVNEQSATQARSELEPAIVDIFMQGKQTWFRLGAISTNNLEEVSKALKNFENKDMGAFVRVADRVPFEKAAQTIGTCRAAGFESVSYLPLEAN